MLKTNYPKAHDILSRKRYQKQVQENLYRFPAGVSWNSIPIFSGTEISYGLELLYSVKETGTGFLVPVSG